MTVRSHKLLYAVFRSAITWRSRSSLVHPTETNVRPAWDGFPVPSVLNAAETGANGMLSEPADVWLSFVTKVRKRFFVSKLRLHFSSRHCRKSCDFPAAAETFQEEEKTEGKRKLKPSISLTLLHRDALFRVPCFSNCAFFISISKEMCLQSSSLCPVASHWTSGSIFIAYTLADMLLLWSRTAESTFDKEIKPWVSHFIETHEKVKSPAPPPICSSDSRRLPQESLFGSQPKTWSIPQDRLTCQITSSAANVQLWSIITKVSYLFVIHGEIWHDFTSCVDSVTWKEAVSAE